VLYAKAYTAVKSLIRVKPHTMIFAAITRHSYIRYVYYRWPALRVSYAFVVEVGPSAVRCLSCRWPAFYISRDWLSKKSWMLWVKFCWLKCLSRTLWHWIERNGRVLRATA